MKLGVKEFRERFSEVAEGQEPVFVTKNGRVIGTYDPLRRAMTGERDWAALEVKLEGIRARWKANTTDWRERLAAEGMDETGAEIDA